MTRLEANKMLIKRFEQLNRVADSIDGDAVDINPASLCALCDSAHKMYITLNNAGAFDEDIEIKGPAGSNFMS